MEIKTEEKEVIDVSRLYTITDYAKKMGVNYLTIVNWIAKMKIRSIFISDNQFIIDDNLKLKDLKKSKSNK